MQYSINEEGQLVVVRNIEKVEVFDLRKKRRELRTSIDSKREAMESLRAEIDIDTAMLQWIRDNTVEEGDDAE